jgi:uncharacterized membrane protein YozB (DUF420 family)
MRRRNDERREDTNMLTGPTVILSLKIAVGAVTVLLLASFVALAKGNIRLHGRINLVFFILTLIALLGFELVIRVINPKVFDYLDEPGYEAIRRMLSIHLCFSIPSALLMPVMLYTGLKGHRRVHLSLAAVFGVLWTGTFVTGVFFLPH